MLTTPVLRSGTGQESISKLHGGLEALGRILFQTFENNTIQFLGNIVFRSLRGGDRQSIDVIHNHGDRIFLLENQLPGEQPVADAAQRIDVASIIHFVPAHCQLRGH